MMMMMMMMIVTNILINETSNLKHEKDLLPVVAEHPCLYDNLSAIASARASVRGRPLSERPTRKASPVRQVYILYYI